MSRAGQLLSAALLRPVNLASLGAGLLLAVTWAPWWIFPLSLVAYGLMVFTTLRDPAFVRRAVSVSEDESAGAPIDWRGVERELGRGPWAPALERISVAENNLANETREAPESARSILASTLAQFRSATRLGIDLARRLRSLDRALRGYAGMNPAASRREAADKRARASAETDEASRAALLQAAGALEESASTAESLRALHGRTSAQLESLAAVLESIAVRGVRLRVASGGGTEELTSSLDVELDAVRETLGVLESMDDGRSVASSMGGGR